MINGTCPAYGSQHDVATPLCMVTASGRVAMISRMVVCMCCSPTGKLL